jgi:hypothetical protein
MFYFHLIFHASYQSIEEEKSLDEYLNEDSPPEYTLNSLSYQYYSQETQISSKVLKKNILNR